MGFVDNLRYAEYSALGYNESYRIANRVVLFIVLAAFVLLIVSFVMLAILASRLKRILDYANRSQSECGNNYIENETARHQLFLGYSEGMVKTIKIIVQTALLLIVIALLVLYGSYFFNKGVTSKWAKGLSLLMGVLLVAFTVTFHAVNKNFNFENRYIGSIAQIGKRYNKDGKNMIGLMSTMMVLVVLACLLNIIYLDEAVGNTSGISSLVLFVGVFVMVFVFILQIRAKQINDRFVIVYNGYKDEINSAIKSLRSDNTNTIKTGTYSGMSVRNWMNIMLSKNIKKTRPNEDIGDPLDMTDNAYANDAYSYMEHQQGKELAELPNADTVNAQRQKIRLNMRNLRRENDAMLAPVKGFSRDINAFVYVLIAMIAFVVYHVSYVARPMMTKLVIVGAILAMVLWLMITIVI